jgi:predicted DNA-binding transcriptional regulator YafY
MSYDSSGRGGHVHRVLRILDSLFHTRLGINLTEVSREYRVDYRTILRDIQLLEDLGYKIDTYNHHRKKYHFLDPDHKKPINVTFSHHEIAALLLSRKLMLPLEGTPFLEGVDTVLDKVKAALPDEAQKLIGTLNKAVWAKYRPYKDYSKQKGLLRDLQTATQDLLKVRVTYTPYGTKRGQKYVFRPYRILRYDGALYLIGWSEKSREVRTLSIDRIKKVEVTKDVFPIDPALDLDRYIEEPFGIIHEGEVIEVKIRFSESIAQHIRERKWHPTQKVSKLKDGSVRVRMQVAGLTDVMLWLLGFGPDAVVESPDVLREKLAELQASAAENNG